MTDALRELVRRRAGDRCEYCRLPQTGHFLPFEVDHVIARQHGGREEPENLALSCVRCNRHKGPNVASVDQRGSPVLLFNPRRHAWHDHFVFDRASGMVIGTTAEGQATVRVLSMNEEDYVLLRLSLAAEGVELP